VVIILHRRSSATRGDGNLQDFIDYIKTKYSLVKFKSDDFSLLRKIMHDYYPVEKIYF